VSIAILATEHPLYGELRRLEVALYRLQSGSPEPTGRRLGWPGGLTGTVLSSAAPTGYPAAPLESHLQSWQSGEQLGAALAEGRGALVFLSHVDNWEVLGARLAAYQPAAALAKPLGNPLVNAYLVRVRERMGIHILSTEDGVRPIIRALKRGWGVGILIDQHVRTAWVPVRFFGRPSAMTAVVASLAVRLGVPVFGAYCEREGFSLRHRATVEGPLELVRTGDTESDIAANTQRFADVVERAVRRHPEQWFWMYSHWRLAKQLAKEGREKGACADDC
jgi:lauroyl/myristoyl acyltransferase